MNILKRQTSDFWIVFALLVGNVICLGLAILTHSGFNAGLSCGLLLWNSYAVFSEFRT